MAEWCMSEVVPKGYRLRPILVEREGARYRAGDLSDFKCVCEASAKVIALREKENLSLVLEPSK